MPKLPKHILVIRLSAMGDVAMCVPVLRAFSDQYPNVKLTILSREFFKPFFRDLPNVSVYGAEVNDKHKGIIGLYRLSRELKSLETSTSLSTSIDAVVDLHNVLRSNILKRLLRIKPFLQIDKGRAEKKALVSGKNFSQLKTTHERYADVFKALGLSIDLSNPRFPKTRALSDTLKVVTGEKATKWIGIAPFAAHKGKMYPINKMLEVIEALPKEWKLFLFGGGDNEITFLKPIANTYKNVVNLAGKLSLEQELDVISNLDVMLSMDSGNAHLAAMLGKKVVTIWGVTHPYAGFAPFNQPEENTLLADRNQFPLIPTSVYGNKYPKHYEQAAGSVLPETIVNKIKSIL